MNISETQNVIRVTKQNPQLSEDEIIEKLLKIDDPVVRPGLDKILLRVCIIHGESPDKVEGISKTDCLSKIRQHYCLLAWLFGYTESQTGDIINRDHSTVNISKKKALNFYHIEKQYRDEVDALIDKFPQHRDELIEKINELLK